MPFLRVELFGQFHRALDIREKHRDLFAFAFEGRLRLQDFVSEMFGRVIARRALGRAGGGGWPCRRDGCAAFGTKLRSREQKLGLTAVACCDAPELLYGGTDPYWESHHDGKDSPSAEWRGRVRAELLPRILDSLFAKFFAPEGILPAARGDEELSTWMLESVKSPVYADAALSDRFNKLFQRDHLSNSESANLRDNAKLYLHMLLFQTRDGSWGGVEKISGIVERVPDLLTNAWDAVVRHTVPFRMASTLLKLKADLVSAGVDAARLIEPEWLVRAAAELAKIKE